MTVNLSTDIHNVAMAASELIGLPTDFTEALIRSEQTQQQLNQTKNPFDVIKQFAIDGGFEAHVVGLWNDIGVAMFDNVGYAILSWRYGLMNYSNYAQFRLDMANPNTTVRQLTKDLADAGYAGKEPAQWIKNVIANYERLSKKSADAPLGSNALINPYTGPKSVPSWQNPTVDNTTMTLSFGEAVLHFLTSAGLVIIGLLAIVIGLFILMQENPTVSTVTGDIMKTGEL